MALFSKGIKLSQNKEPALSYPLITFVNSTPEYFAEPRVLTSYTDKLTNKEIIDIAKAAGIYDERDGRLLVSKLRRAENRAEIVIIDAVDDEPYISSKLNPMINFPEDLELGIDLCVQVAGVATATITIYKYIGHTRATIPTRLGGYRVERLKGGYPALPSFSEIRDRGKEERMVVGVGALIHLARAVRLSIPQTSTFITVAGNSVANPMNMEVSIGMNVAEVLDRCGLVQPPTKVVIGGSMTGISLQNPEATLITHTTRSILAFHGDKHDRAYPCIGCGRCEQNCPSGLNPMYISQIMNRRAYQQLPLFSPESCIGCGTCSYICPSNIDVVGSVQSAKRYTLKKQGKDPSEEDVF